MNRYRVETEFITDEKIAPAAHLRLNLMGRLRYEGAVKAVL